MILDMIPTLNTNWVIRGTKEIPRLYNIENNKIIKLNNEILKYILDCDGTNNYLDIINKYDLSKDEVHSFYKQFIDENVIVERKIKKEIKIDCHLGPKEPWLKEVHIDTTNYCNLRCKHCFWGSNLKNEVNIPFEKWEKVLDDISKFGVAKIVLSGGETFTNHDLLNFIKSCYNKKIMISSIFTNGTIYDENAKKIIEFLTKKKLTTFFYISLDGYTAEQHDFIRGKGNFDKTIFFIRELMKNKIKYNAKYNVMINTLLHKKNYSDLISFYNFLDELNVHGWRFTTGRVSGFFKLNANMIQVSSLQCFNEYKKLINYVIKKYNRGENILYLNIENFFTTKALIDKKMYIFDENLQICDYKSNACSIDPKGNVQFCTGWQDIKYGNVFEKNIGEIWLSDNLQKLKQMKIKDIKDCKGCKHLKYCGGGCRLECKNIYAKDTGICENFDLFEDEMIPILKKTGIEFIVE